LVQLYEALQAQSQQIMQGSLQTLETILAAENKEQALQENAANIDDNFMAVLMARLQEAEQQGDEAGLQGLSEIYDLIVQQMTASMPEDIQFLNDLVRQPDQAAQEALMQSRPELVTAGLIDLIDQVLAQGGQGVDETVRQRLESLKGLINTQMLAN
jgi:predicted RND superfamily exporter protein